jgi:DNA invertase Pin-like site-specific DNA recombinase
MTPSRTFGYVALIDPRVESPEVQRENIERYCQQIGRRVDGLYVDTAASGKLRLFEREAGRQLLHRLRRNDHVVFARLDCLDRSFKGFGTTLKVLGNLGVVVHLCDVPGVLDPRDPYIRVLIKMLVSFTEYERRMIGLQTGQALNSLKAEGRRYSRFAPYGFEFQRRGKKTVMVPKPREQEIRARVVALSADGYSTEQIREYLAFEWKVRNRNGNTFGRTEVANMVARGTQWLNDEVCHSA